MPDFSNLRRTAAAGALVGCLAPAPAGANDSTASLAAGGLTFTRNADIEMRAEDLSISEKEVVVRYRFFNRAGADQTATVAFPMPEISAREDRDVAIPDSESDNFLNFRTTVEGRPVDAQIERKAMVGSRDVTRRLTALGLPLLPTAQKTGAALDALGKDVQAQLLAEKIVRLDEFDAGKGWEKHIAPEWRLRTTYFWRQTFPAGREIAIEHRYAPSVGASVQTSVGASYATAADRRDYETRFCADADFVSGVKAMTRRNGNVPPPEYRISYVLTTGANWAGPIGDYRLVVDKGTPDALVSFCETGVKKIGPTTFEVRRRNFTPTRDIDILIVRRGG